jgi:hypothetical protein
MDFFKSSEVENKDTGSGKNVFSDAFVDKMNDDFKKAQEVCETSNEIVDSLHDLPEKDLADETVFVDKLPEVAGIDFILGLFSNEFLNSVHNSYGFNLSENEIAESVQKASDFFHLNSPKDIREDWTTGVILGMKQKGNDDVLYFNREQMKEMCITDREGFDLLCSLGDLLYDVAGVNTGREEAADFNVCNLVHGDGLCEFLCDRVFPVFEGLVFFNLILDAVVALVSKGIQQRIEMRIPILLARILLRHNSLHIQHIVLGAPHLFVPCVIGPADAEWQVGQFGLYYLAQRHLQ